MQSAHTLLCKQANKYVIRSFAVSAGSTPRIQRKASPPISDSYNARIQRHFKETYELSLVKRHIPQKYLVQNRQHTLRHSYLMNKLFAKDIVNRIWPYLKDQVICETNVGLGLITNELIKQGVENIRVYEVCPEFRKYLRTLVHFPLKIELFARDLYNINTLLYFDRHDKANRVHGMLDGLPTRRWNEAPGWTIIGPMPNLNFIRYLTRAIALQDEFLMYGRPQVFALVQPEDYHRLNASPEMSLLIYRTTSILFQLFFNYQVLHKYCKKSFLPWRNVPVKFEQQEDENVLLIRIIPKMQLPVSNEYLPHLLYFVIDGFKRGHQRVIPTMEKWVPGIGTTLIVPPQKYKKHFRNSIDIFTEFRELRPSEILQLFLIMMEHPDFHASPFIPMMETHLVKDETIDSDLVESDDKLSDIVDEKS